MYACRCVFGLIAYSTAKLVFLQVVRLGAKARYHFYSMMVWARGHDRLRHVSRAAGLYETMKGTGHLKTLRSCVRRGEGAPCQAGERGLLNSTNSIIFVSCSRDFSGCCSTPKYWNSYIQKNGFTRQSPPITSNHLPITSKNHHQSPSNHLAGRHVDTANLVLFGH